MSGALLYTANIPSARADGDGVVVKCPNLSEATAAELEARARATLLTSDLSATATISCFGETVEVRADAGAESVTLSVRAPPPTLREEALRALDRALADLGARGAPASTTSSPSTAHDETAPLPTPVPVPLAPAAHETSPGPQPVAVSPRAIATQVGVYVLAESWGHGSALGGGVVGALRWGSTGSLGIRFGALDALRLREATVVEGHALVEAAVTIPTLAGLSLGVAAGPSLLSASPASGFAAPSSTMKSALRIEARIGRPFRWRALELTPWIGARTFSADRGVRVAERSRLVLGGVHPQIGLALSLIH